VGRRGGRAGLRRREGEKDDDINKYRNVQGGQEEEEEE